jgi:iron(III) transport system permease protein
VLRWLAIGGARVWKTDEIASTLGQTLLFGATGAILATLAAAPIAWLAIRRPTRFARALEGLNYVTGHCGGACSGDDRGAFCPPALSDGDHGAAGLRDHVSAARFDRPSGQRRPPPVEFEEVARSLGRSPAQALWSITLRLAAPGAAAGAAMVFLGIVNELTATLLLAPNGTETLATSFWALSGELDYAAAAPLRHDHGRPVAATDQTAPSAIAAPGRAVTVLELSRVSKFYGSTRAVEGVDLIVPADG